MLRNRKIHSLSLALALCALATAAAFASRHAAARDSLWLLCKGDAALFGEKAKLALNLHEHRQGADGRETDLALIYGGHVLQGSLDTTDSTRGTVTLQGSSSETFEGQLAIDFSRSSISLSGSLDLSDDESTPLQAKLNCETMGE